MIVLVRVHIGRFHYVKHCITELTFVDALFIQSLGGHHADIYIVVDAAKNAKSAALSLMAGTDVKKVLKSQGFICRGYKR
ncbi:hypothetical protein M378DRAFT_162325 [Amanita muscaria Koide BX008]|uniref:Uncharacterized protein n=1 Tax=Amanita muscaria (strain Koide BX008) TaxID=946122 RepID=A0A0C2X8K2_AMAMK|nr:hypothetical protein M378DRAFT_162325 [Amanita muscaria Koide BX008]